MNRNTELHFKNTPQINIRRSKFERSHNHKTSFNVGDVIPLYVDADILPGDTVQMDMASLVRMATPIYPIMDNLFIDTYWFFVPHRLVWDNWRKFWGENDDPWIQQTEFEIPQITAPSGGWNEGTIADYMGIPTKVQGFSVNALPFRAYCKCWNDFMRDENLKSCAHIYTDETTRQGLNTGDYVTSAEFGAKPLKIAKFHDYFTTALPSPQKGPAVMIPSGTSAPISGNIPITLAGTLSANTTLNGLGNKNVNTSATSHDVSTNTLKFNTHTQGLQTGTYLPYINVDGTIANLMGGQNTTPSTTTILNMIPNNLVAEVNGITANTTVTNGLTATANINNLYADLSQATAASVNQLRTAFAIQKYYENAALHGTRYIEYVRSVFGVTSSDARFQRAEYLGGKRVPINIDQVLQTSATDQTSPQGNTAAFSCTIDKAGMFTKSFEEHGTLLCLAAIRCEHTYQQGLNRMWSRKKWTDFYNPFFAHLGEQAILNKEIYVQNNDAKNNEAFGYQEAWADYRYKPSYVSGYMRSNASGSLDVWHFADNYNTLPILGSTWIDEPYENVDRTIAVTSQLTHQFIADFYFKTFYTRPMPVYSVPGLIDHV